jgi:hypothetical protein
MPARAWSKKKRPGHDPGRAGAQEPGQTVGPMTAAPWTANGLGARAALRMSQGNRRKGSPGPTRRSSTTPGKAQAQGRQPAGHRLQQPGVGGHIQAHDMDKETGRGKARIQGRFRSNARGWPSIQVARAPGCRPPARPRRPARVCRGGRAIQVRATEGAGSARDLENGVGESEPMFPSTREGWGAAW